MRVKQWMQELKETGKYEVPEVTKQKIKEVFWAGCCNDEETFKTIHDTEATYSYVLDTHTAVGKNVYDQYVTETEDHTKTIIAATASPFKFNKSVLDALQGAISLDGKTEFELLDMLSEKSGLRVPKSLAELIDKPVLHQIHCYKEEMKQMVSDILRIE